MKEIENLKLKNKPFIIDFWAPWCGPCKTMRPIVESLKNDSFNLLCSNVEESQDLADYFGIRNVPTILFFDKDFHLGTFCQNEPQKLEHILHLKPAM